MKAVQVLSHGRPGEVVRVSEVAEPEPGPGEVRIAVAAASLNFGDGPRALGGVAMAMLKPPFTLGMDVCGRVEAAGPGGEAWLGRRVVAMTKMALGGMAEKAIAPVTGLFDAPPELDDAAAAGFLLPYHVSYLGLHVRAQLQPGESVLVTGAASGVGTAAVQLAAAAGRASDRARRRCREDRPLPRAGSHGDHRPPEGRSLRRAHAAHRRARCRCRL